MTIVNSWNEWDTLKHVIVGTVEHSNIPPMEPALEPKISKDSGMAIPLSLLILGSKAGSIGGMFECSTVPTITCFSVSHSFHELTIVIFVPIN